MPRRTRKAQSSLLKTVLPGAGELIWNNLINHLGIPSVVTRFLSTLNTETAVDHCTTQGKNRQTAFFYKINDRKSFIEIKTKFNEKKMKRRAI